ncbi:MAG: ABC-2 transporter permease [Oscillospiraceae bacterium]|nr:ABC-2 transporter permease [Oscillospiraceae bacterium]
MMPNLLRKELRLARHPAALFMPWLSVLCLVPNYPYPVMYFYLTLGVFFICMSGRENNDVGFTLTLPVTRRELVAARFGFVMLLEAFQLLLACAFVALRALVFADRGSNAAGMDANLALIGEGFLFYAAFHLSFFPSYYRDVTRVGVSFVKSSVLLGLMVTAEIVACYAVPFWRDTLDRPDPEHFPAKLVFLGLCALCYALASFASLRVSQRRFARLDLR